MNGQNETPETPPLQDGFPFRYALHTDHLRAPRESMLAGEIKKIIAEHVADFDGSEPLVLEDVGDEVDRLLKDDDAVDMASVPHFYSASHVRHYTIYVNAEEKSVQKREVSFEDVVAIAFPNPKPGLEVRYTVTYKRAVAPKPQGRLAAGHSVTIRKNGTIFDVVRTYKS